MSTASTRPRIILPPGWVMIPVTEDNRAAATATFADAWSRGPSDSIGPFIHRMEAWLLQLLDDARRGNGIAVVMPMGVPWLVPVSTGIVLSRVTPAAHAPALPAVGELVDTDSGPARRRTFDRPVPDDADPESLVLLRTIEYTWVTPDERSYLVAFASISGLPVAEYAPVADALTVLIETMLDALDWPDVADSGNAASTSAAETATIEPEAAR